MTPTPPPETETARDLVLAEPLRDLAREFTFDADNAARDLGGPDRPEPPFDSEETGRVQGLRTAASRLADTVETLTRYSPVGEVATSIEYRVRGTHNEGRPVESAEIPDHADAERIAREWRDGGWTGVRVESRTVRTWSSSWRPVVNPG